MSAPRDRADPAASAAPRPLAVHGGLACFRFGAGPPLLLMPYGHALSIVGSPHLAGLIAGLVACGRTVLTFDPPASGQSPRPTRLSLAEFLDCAAEALAVAHVAGPVDLFGHSQGGVAALAYAVERPTAVRRLILANTSSGGPAFRQAPGAIWRCGHPDFARFALRAICFVLWPRLGAERWMNNLIFRNSYVDWRYFTPTPISAADWLRRPRPRAAWGRRVAPLIDYRARLGTVRAPTLVLAGRHDPQMPPACAEALAAGIPNARLVVFERSGHYPFVEEAGAFWTAVRAFLAGEPSRPIVAAREATGVAG